MSQSEQFIFVNLKRFEIPRALGGLSESDDPVNWIGDVVDRTVALGIGAQEQLNLIYLLPEGLLHPALEAQRRAGGLDAFAIGCQGVHWEDVEAGGNFGAFTALLPARAARALGASWAIIGHSEERRAKLQLIEAYDHASSGHPESQDAATEAVNQLIGREVRRALEAGLNVLLCVGETEQQRGTGTLEETAVRLEAVLESQLGSALLETGPLPKGRRLIVGYEPIWAIGPGKEPPGADYIHLAASLAKQVGQRTLGATPPVVYGGGLKLANAGMLGELDSVDGGLVALTRFSGDIGFSVDDLAAIADAYLGAVSRGAPR